MSRLLNADFYRMYSKKLLWLCTLSMMVAAAALCLMQYTAMDYEVSLDRVIFLPMAFYGIAVSVLIGVFTGEDFSDGVIRNKIISGHSRYSIYTSNLLVCYSACIIVYIMTIITALGIGINWFDINVTTEEVMRFAALGIFTCLAYSSIYCMITMLVRNKTAAIAMCMAIAFGMLFLALHTNAFLMRPEYKDGALNPQYAVGIKRILYEFLYDVNPTGQAAQLSMMKCLNPMRFILIDVLWVLITGILGTWMFNKTDIK